MVRKYWLQWATHIGALLPLALLLWDVATNNLSFNPIQDITYRTGYPAIILLMLSLACTPVNIIFGVKQVIPLRKPLGLYGFLYVTLHLLTFAVLDYQLNWHLIGEAISEKRYVLVGFAAFLLLVPVALTSTKGWMRRLGKNWKKLHQLVYVIVPLGVLHYLWLVKADIRQPMLFGLIVAVLLLVRVPLVRRAISSIRSRWFPKAAPRQRAKPVQAAESKPASE